MSSKFKAVLVTMSLVLGLSSTSLQSLQATEEKEAIAKVSETSDASKSINDELFGPEEQQAEESVFQREDPTEEKEEVGEYRIELMPKDPENPIEKTLHRHLLKAASDYESGNPKWLEENELVHDYWTHENLMAVEIFFNQEELPMKIEDLLTSYGGKVAREYTPIWIAARIPIGHLKALAKLEGIRIIRPERTMSTMSVSEGLYASRANYWKNRAGLKGEGIKMLVIDEFNEDTLNAQQASGEVTHNLTRVDFGSAITTHGNQVLEIIHDTAPNLERIIAVNTRTSRPLVSDVIAGIAEGISNGVHVMSMSLGMTIDGYNDGVSVPGSITQELNRAFNAGIFVAVPAGNEALLHWSGYFTAMPGDANTMDWNHSGTRQLGPTAGNISMNKFVMGSSRTAMENDCLPAGLSLEAALGLDRSAPVTSHYDVLIMRQAADNQWYIIDAGVADGTPHRQAQAYTSIQASSPTTPPTLMGFMIQNNGFQETSIPGGQASGCGPDATRYAAVILRNGPGDSPIAGNHYLNFFGSIVGAQGKLQIATAASSILGSSASNTVFTVGAAQCNTDTLNAANTCSNLNPTLYSSEGPVLGQGGVEPRRPLFQFPNTLPSVKPDATSFADVTTSLNAPGTPRFSGTSAATPQVAAMAALFIQRFKNHILYRPIEVNYAFKNLANFSLADMDLVNRLDYPRLPDNSIGHGLLRFQVEAAIEWYGKLNHVWLTPRGTDGRFVQPANYMTMSPLRKPDGSLTSPNGSDRYLEEPPTDSTQNYRFTNGLRANNIVLVRFTDNTSANQTRPVLYPSIVPYLTINRMSSVRPASNIMIGGDSPGHIFPYAPRGLLEPAYKPLSEARQGYFAFNLSVNRLPTDITGLIGQSFYVNASAARSGATPNPSGAPDRTPIFTTTSSLLSTVPLEYVFREYSSPGNFNVCDRAATFTGNICPEMRP